MKINLNTLSPLNAVIDSKSGTAAAVSNMMNYYVDSGKAVPFNVSKKNLPVTPVSPLTEIAEWHFSEVDMVKVGKAFYEVDKSDGSVMPVGVILGKVTLSDNGSGGFLSTGGEEIIGAEHIASADGVKGITTVERTVGKVACCCSADGKVIVYGGANGAYSINSGTSWTTLSYNFVSLSMKGAAGSIIWGATATALYKSLDSGATWTSVFARGNISVKSTSETEALVVDPAGTVWVANNSTMTQIDGVGYFALGNSRTYFDSNNILMSGDAVYTQSCVERTFSDEPVGATSWAWQDGSVWKDRYGNDISIPELETVTYMCMTYGVMGFYGGFLYKGSRYGWGGFPASMAVINNGTEVIVAQANYGAKSKIFKVNLSTFLATTIWEGTTVNTQNYSTYILANPKSPTYAVTFYTSSPFTKRVYSGTVADYTYPIDFVDDLGNFYFQRNTDPLYKTPYNSNTPAVFTMFDSFQFYDGQNVLTMDSYGSLFRYFKNGVTQQYVKTTPYLSRNVHNFSGFTYFGEKCFIKKEGTAQYAIIGTVVFVSNDKGLGKIENGIYRNISNSLSNCSMTVSGEFVMIGGADGIYKCDLSGAITFIGATLSMCTMGGSSPFIGTNVGAIYLLGITSALGQRVWNVKVTRASSGYNIATLATNTTPLVAGTYILLGGVTGNPVPIIDPATARQMIMFRDDNAIVWKKKIEEYLEKFFGTAVFSGIESMYTYLPDMVSQFGARMYMAGGYELSSQDNILNGTFDANIASWIVSNVTWGSAYGISGGGALIANGYMRQTLPEKSFCVALVKGAIGDLAATYPIYPFSGSWYLVVLGFQTAINLFSTGSMYVDSVHAYDLSSLNTTVSISDVANYEDFFNGSGSQQKVPSSDNVINGIVPIGKSLYVIKDNSTGKIDETGDVNNPFYVTEEYVMEGGFFPARFGNSFIVIRKRPSSGDTSIGAEIYLFNGQGYERLNATWNNEWSTDEPFNFERLHVATIGDMSLVGDDAAYVAILEDNEKIGVAGFSLPGSIEGDITDGAYNSMSSSRNIVAFTHNANPDAIKKLKGVSVLPEQDAVFRIWKTADATIHTASSAIGSCGFNLSGADFYIRVDAEEKIGQIIINEDTIMPRTTK